MNDELAGLDLIGLLGLLEPVPTPPPVSLWPETLAWLWVGLAVVAFAGWLIRRAWLQRRANLYRREALREIKNAGGSVAKLSEIIRRTALAAYPRTDVAGLFGDEWLAFLDRTGRLGGRGEADDFTRGPGRAFAWAPYRIADDDEEGSANALAGLAARWVRSHRLEPGDEL